MKKKGERTHGKGARIRDSRKPAKSFMKGKAAVTLTAGGTTRDP